MTRDTQESGPASVEVNSTVDYAVQAWTKAVVVRPPVSPTYTREEGWSELGRGDKDGVRLLYWRGHADPKFYDKTRLRQIKTTRITTVVREVLE